MTPKTIPLGAVRAALTGAVTKSQSQQCLARTVAMTRYEPLAHCCASHRPHVAAPAVHFGVMERGELARLVMRVQTMQGPAEVRKTWDQGAKLLLAAIGTGFMR